MALKNRPFVDIETGRFESNGKTLRVSKELSTDLPMGLDETYFKEPCFDVIDFYEIDGIFLDGINGCMFGFGPISNPS